ncbi:hypothetical protein K8M07_05100 [Schnuerera sp. xch1]|uniref:methyl-accepting chemotaxis protein n=1 Tax=Schnuerera sp. xch1 TaxID=2874283 RepID=UPI001CBE13DA|nr:methyl-accepting chemotaxis protein [Schnuerera sp. xch1]MBZ2174621.1 hypothetical protein [Schnuerera sp. xch1]
MKLKTKKKNFNKHSIKVRLLIVPIIMVIIGIAAMGTISTYNTKQSLLNEMRENGQFTLDEFISRMEDNSKSLEAVNNSIENQIRIAAKSIMKLEGELNNQTVTQLAEDLGIVEINIFNSQGVIMYSNLSHYVGWKPAENHPLNAFFESNETELIEEIRKDTLSNTYKKYGTIKSPDGSAVQIGLLANDINALTEQFSYQRLIDDLAANDNIVYAVFIDENLQATAHSIKERIGLDLSEDEAAISAVVDDVSHTSEYSFGEEKIPVYDIAYPAIVNGENVGAVNIGFSMESVNSAINKNVLTVIISGILATLAIGAFLFFTSNYAVKIIHKLKDIMGFMAKGDFSIDVPQSLRSKKDEFGEISRSVNIMRNSIANIIKNVSDSSQMVAAHSEELTATTEQSSRASSEISKAVEDIASSASEQAKDVEQGFETVTELGNVVVKNADYIKNLNNSIEKVNQLKDEGTELIGELVEKNNMSNKASNQIKEVINSTNQSAEKIASASEMIKSIAEQTNLLALNAAIEAARAGETGRGFAVVADEIRNLAEQSNQFTEEISTIINDLTEKTSMAVQTMKEVGKITDSRNTSVNMTSSKFDGISKSIEEMKKVINTVNESSNEMAAQKEKIANIMENLSAISQENAAGSQQASASIEEQTAGMSEITSASEELASIAEQLNSQVEQFKI